MIRTALASLVAALGIAAGPVALAQQTPDTRSGLDDRAHAAAAAKADPRLRANNASLDSILADAQGRHPGRVIEVSYDDGEYDIEIRGDDGRIAEFEYSARTGRLIEIDYD